MAAPKTTENVGHIHIAFEEQKLRAIVRRLKLHSSDKRVTGELMLACGGAGFEASEHIHRSEFNFSSASTRRSLAKQLAERYPVIDWADILEHICNEVATIAWRGEPIEELSTEEDVGPEEYLIAPLIPLHQPTVIFGDGATGKSSFALVCYVCAQLPWKDNKLGLIPPDKPVRGLYLDWETDARTFTRRLQALERGMKLPQLSLNYRSCSHTLADDIEQIREAIVATESEFLVVDSLAGACGGDLTGSDGATAFYNALRQLKLTTLIIAHNPKGDGKKTIYGSVVFEHRARSVWECRAAMDEETNAIDIGLHHRKANNSRLSKPLGFNINYNGNSMSITTKEVARMPELRKELSLTQLVIETLKRGKMRLRDLASELGYENDKEVEVVRAKLNWMATKGITVHLPDGSWGLKARDVL